MRFDGHFGHFGHGHFGHSKQTRGSKMKKLDKKGLVYLLSNKEDFAKLCSKISCGFNEKYLDINKPTEYPTIAVLQEDQVMDGQWITYIYNKEAQLLFESNI